MKIEIKHTSELTTAEREHIDAWMEQTFSAEWSGYEWAHSEWHVLLMIDGQPVSHAELVERTGTVNSQPVHLGGVGGVTTLPEWRGRGLATAVMGAATAFLRDRLGVAFGLLICGKGTAPLYRRLGWEIVEGPLLFDQRGGKVTFSDGVTMVLPCTEKTWPTGTIDLCGLPW